MEKLKLIIVNDSIKKKGVLCLEIAWMVSGRPQKRILASGFIPQWTKCDETPFSP